MRARLPLPRPLRAARRGLQPRDPPLSDGPQFRPRQGLGHLRRPRAGGPWTTAYITRDWGQGDTHGYRLPTKWMSPDGKEMYVVFSGRGRPNAESNDAFCLGGLRWSCTLSREPRTPLQRALPPPPTPPGCARQSSASSCITSTGSCSAIRSPPSRAFPGLRR